ncbi:ribosome biogenesis protein Nop16 [Trametes punicea]|nr:ribosome biogenesis protein Nop16 [Trametes punicea]
MANPRQRRKLRSGSHKPVQHSRRAKKLLKKQPPIRGPKVLQEAWDPRKTVRQNYEALGLAASLNPIASGGTERKISSSQPAHGDRSETQPEASSSKPTAANGVPKGYGKIIRDADGNVVDVQLGDEEDEKEAEAMEEVLDDIPDPTEDDQAAGWVGLGSERKKRSPESAGTRVVRALEQLSETRGGPVRRYTSQGELTTLRRLVARYGEDVEAMARDRKLNADQRTAGELQRAIRKAGGFAELGKAG